MDARSGALALYRPPPSSTEKKLRRRPRPRYSVYLFPGSWLSRLDVVGFKTTVFQRKSKRGHLLVNRPWRRNYFCVYLVKCGILTCDIALFLQRRLFWWFHQYRPFLGSSIHSSHIPTGSLTVGGDV